MIAAMPMIRPFVLVGAMVVALGVLTLPGHIALTALLIVAGASAALVYPPAMVAAVILSVPVQDSVVLPFAGGQVTLTQLALISLMLGWSVVFWRRTVWLDAVTWWYLLIMAAFAASLLALDDVGLWAAEVYRWGVAAAFYVVCRSVLRDWQAIRVALGAMAVAVLAVSAYGVGQFIGNAGPEHMMRGGVLRVFGPFGTPNPFAAYMEFVVPLMLALALAGLHREVRERIGLPLWLAMSVAAAMGSLIVALTQSRGGWVGFAAAMVVLLWAVPLRWRTVVVGGGAVVIALILLTPPGQSQLRRFETSLDTGEPLPIAVLKSADTGREPYWGAAISMFEERPLTGVGAGEYDYHYRQHTSDWHYRFPIGQAHSGYLHMAAQAGIPGVLAFVGWLGAMLVSLVAATWRSSEPVARAMALGAVAVVVAFGVHSVVDYLNVLSLGLQLSAVVAIGLSLAPHPRPLEAPRRSRQYPTLTPQQAGNA